MTTIAANAHHLDGATMAIIGSLVLGVGIIVLLVGYALAMIPGAISWNSLKKEHPEIHGLKGLGLVTILTFGLPLAGIWPLMVVKQKSLSNDAQIGDWLRTPIRLWMAAYLVSVTGMFLGGPFRDVGYVIAGTLNLGSMVKLILGGRNSNDPLMYVAANSYIKLCICNLLMFAFMFGLKPHPSASSPSLANLLFFLISTVGTIYYIYHQIRGNVALLAVFRRCLPAGTGNLAAPLFGLGLLVTVFSFGLLALGLFGSLPGLS